MRVQRLEAEERNMHTCGKMEQESSTSNTCSESHQLKESPLADQILIISEMKAILKTNVTHR